jgi:hypothetical protein
MQQRQRRAHAGTRCEVVTQRISEKEMKEGTRRDSGQQRRTPSGRSTMPDLVRCAFVMTPSTMNVAALSVAPSSRSAEHMACGSTKLLAGTF